MRLAQTAAVVCIYANSRNYYVITCTSILLRYLGTALQRLHDGVIHVYRLHDGYAKKSTPSQFFVSASCVYLYAAL